MEKNVMYYNLGVRDAYCGIVTILRDKGVEEALNVIISNTVILAPENPHLELARNLVEEFVERNKENE